jgi:hypothetical protein
LILTGSVIVIGVNLDRLRLSAPACARSIGSGEDGALETLCAARMRLFWFAGKSDKSKTRSSIGMTVEHPPGMPETDDTHRIGKPAELSEPALA